MHDTNKLTGTCQHHDSRTTSGRRPNQAKKRTTKPKTHLELSEGPETPEELRDRLLHQGLPLHGAPSRRLCLLSGGLLPLQEDGLCPLQSNLFPGEEGGNVGANRQRTGSQGGRRMHTCVRPRARRQGRNA